MPPKPVSNLTTHCLIRMGLPLMLVPMVWMQLVVTAQASSHSIHPISITETDIFVTRTRAIVRIQLFAEDLILFQDLEPNDMDMVSPQDLQRGLEQHKQFLLEKVTLRSATGEALQGSVTDLKPFTIPEGGIAVSDMMLHTATYQLDFPFEEPPEFLTIQQDISDANFIFPSEMKLSVHQTGSDLTFTDSLKAGGSVTLRFDWTNTPLAEDASDEEWEKWFARQREATLGITSYSSVYSFIYVEPAEVRHEVLIPLATLKTILPLKHQDASFIDVAEQDDARQLIRDWLKDVNPTLINQKQVVPEFSRIDFYGLDLKDFARQAEARRVSMANGRVGVIMTYRTGDDVIRSASLTWNKFHSTIRKIESVIFTYPDTTQKFEFSRFNKPEDNTFSWQCEDGNLPKPAESIPAVVPQKPQLRLPLISMALTLVSALVASRGASGSRLLLSSGLLLTAALASPFAAINIDNPLRAAPEIEQAQAIELLTRLQNNMYRAVDFGSEEKILTVLETAIDGPLLEDVYLQIRKGLEMREQGGAVARVRSISHDLHEYLPRGEESPPWPGFSCRSTWTVAGTVEHWGHIHERQNQFEALFSVEPRGGSWKITAMTVENQQQKSQRTTVRKF